MANDDASGYMGSMDIGFGGGGKVLSNSGFADITELYVSNSGHARLFTATRYGKKYILKCLKEDYLYVPTYRTALAKEFEIGLQLDHDNVRRTVGMETIQGLGDVIIMEYVDGCTLKSLIDNGRLTKPLARKVASQLASALDYMHGKQIVHRDLKPSNIMLMEDGSAKLGDFGISTRFESAEGFGGTPAYQAPGPQAGYGAPGSQAASPVSFGETTVLGGGAPGETTVLGQSVQQEQMIPQLIRKKTGEQILLNKPVYRIGKERSYVDYFIGDNTAISRSHANFITRDGEYFVVDTNSTNHTFVNGSMIQSNAEIKLKHGDRIRLANEDFEFRLY